MTERKVPVWRRPLWIAIALVLTNLAIYWRVRHFAFVNWDDPSYLTENPHLIGGLTWHNVAWAVTTAYTPYWHPMTWLSHLLDVQLFGLDAGPHHVTSLVIHIANTLLLFEGLRRLTGAIGRSAFVAAIFAAHPLHVESVAWLAERKDVLSALFLLLTMWTYAVYVQRPRAARYVVVVALYALALMSKPMVVTLPVLLVLIDIWPLRRVSIEAGQGAAWTRVLIEKIPLLVLALATSVPTFVIQRQVGAIAGLGALPWAFRLANALVAYVAYVGKAFWPLHLAPFYPMHDLSPWLVGAAALSLVAATAAAFYCRRTHPYVLVGWLWFVASIAPVIGLVQAGEQAMADRFIYVAIVGLTVVVAWSVPALAARWRLAPAVVPAVATAAFLSCATLAWAQVQSWSDSVTLWRHAVSVTDGNYRGYEKLAEAQRDRGELDEALANYVRALDAAANSAPTYRAVISNDIGLVYVRQGRTDDAIAAFETAVRLEPGFAEAEINLGNALASAGRLPEAVERFHEAIRVRPDLTEALVGLGGTLLRQGRPTEAMAPFNEALRLAPDLAEAHNGLGSALTMQHQDEQALAQYERALQLNPGLATAHFNEGVLLAKAGRIDDAVRHLEAALRIDPGYEPARHALEVIRRRLP